MSQQAPRKCGVCQRAPREGEDNLRIRFAPEDVAAVKETLKLKQDLKPGLYSCCVDCHEGSKAIVLERHRANPQAVGLSSANQVTESHLF